MQCGGEPRSVHGLLPQIRTLLLPQAFAIESALKEQDTPLLRHSGPVLVYRGGAASPGTQLDCSFPKYGHHRSEILIKTARTLASKKVRE